MTLFGQKKNNHGHNEIISRFFAHTTKFCSVALLMHTWLNHDIYQKHALRITISSYFSTRFRVILMKIRHGLNCHFKCVTVCTRSSVRSGNFEFSRSCNHTRHVLCLHTCPLLSLWYRIIKWSSFDTSELYFAGWLAHIHVTKPRHTPTISPKKKKGKTQSWNDLPTQYWYLPGRSTHSDEKNLFWIQKRIN